VYLITRECRSVWNALVGGPGSCGHLLPPPGWAGGPIDETAEDPRDFGYLVLFQAAGPGPTIPSRGGRLLDLCLPHLRFEEKTQIFPSRSAIAPPQVIASLFDCPSIAPRFDKQLLNGDEFRIGRHLAGKLKIPDVRGA